MMDGRLVWGVGRKKRVGEKGGSGVANPEHVEILKQGVEVWNKWREENPEIIPNLMRANLSKMELCGINLNEAYLVQAFLERTNFENAQLVSAVIKEADIRGAKLQKANLEKANLSRANLKYAQLCDARIAEASLVFANMSKTDLTAANFTYANLSGADLSKADLKNSLFQNARMGQTCLGFVDLSTAIGLKTVEHAAPSTIGLDTIYLSKGKIPELFLRGCGVPEDFIKLIPSLTSQPFQFYSCFISYSSQDDDFARRLHADLQSNAVRVWFAPEDMKIGDKIWECLDRSIRIHDKLLLVLSEQSINSNWVEDEVTTAFEEERRRKKTVLFPIRLDDAVMDTNKAWAAKVRQRHIGDFTDWKNHDSYKEAFDRLLRDLKASEE